MIKHSAHPPYESDRLCLKCGVNKGRMRWHSTRNKYRLGWCTDCQKENNQKHRDLHAWKGEEMFDGKLKQCSRCNRSLAKTRESWEKLNTNPDGIKPYCKSCHNARRFGMESCQQTIKIREIQNDKCPMCDNKKLPENGGAKIDHDYGIVAYGKEDPRWKTTPREILRSSVRGLLCNYHNIMMGFLDAFFADEKLQERYNRYIEDPPAQKVLC